MSESTHPLSAYTDEQLAYHEAGHAVIHALQGGTVSRVSIECADPPRGVQLPVISSTTPGAAPAGEMAASMVGDPPDDMSNEVDAALVQRSLAGDEAAFGALVVRHQSRLLRLCCRLVGDQRLFEDCAQEACLLAALRLSRLRSIEQFGAWLRGIGVRVCQRALHQAGAGPLLVSLDAADGLDAEAGSEQIGNAVARSELSAALRAAVQALPPGQLAAVHLFYPEGLSCQEAATSLGIPAGALKVRLHKARAALRHRFGLDAGYTPSSPLPASRLGAAALAIHEAAHAVLHWQRGGSVAAVAITPNSGVQIQEVTATPPMARCQTSGRSGRPEPAMPARDVLEMLMAGDAATALWRRPKTMSFSASDRRSALGRPPVGRRR